MDDSARRTVTPFVFGEAAVSQAERRIEDRADLDSFGNEGTMFVETVVAGAASERGRDEVCRLYREAGFAELPGDSHRDDDAARFRLDRLDPSDPFLFENEIEVGVRGRALTGIQRKVLETKVRSLRAEISARDQAPDRRTAAAQMLEDLREGLLTRLDVSIRRRWFLPRPPHLANGVMGEVIPLSALSQLVYSVAPLEPDAEEEPMEPMFITLLGCGPNIVTVLFSGGIACQRTARDLEGGVAHHAWFRNRHTVSTEDTAPWIGRKIFRELSAAGESLVIVRRERDPEPIAIRRTGEGERPLRIHGEIRSVPVLKAETAKDDRLSILADPLNPLVLELIERGADLRRTIDEIRRLESR